MVNPRFLDVLRLVEARLRGAPVVWAVTGSLGLALHGMPVNPGDVDLQSDAAGAYEIERRLAEYRREPLRLKETARGRSHFGALEMDGMKVEIIGDMQYARPGGGWTEPPDLARLREWVEVEDLAALIDAGLSFIPGGSVIYRLIQDLRE
jgi:hypothetical protein